MRRGEAARQAGIIDLLAPVISLVDFRDETLIGMISTRWLQSCLPRACVFRRRRRRGASPTTRHRAECDCGRPAATGFTLTSVPGNGRPAGCFASVPAGREQTVWERTLVDIPNQVLFSPDLRTVVTVGGGCNTDENHSCCTG